MSEVIGLDIDKLLSGLFDFQKFEKDPALQELIDDTLSRYCGEELSDDELTMLSAAGDPFSQSAHQKERDKTL